MDESLSTGFRKSFILLEDFTECFYEYIEPPIWKPKLGMAGGMQNRARLRI